MIASVTRMLDLQPSVHLHEVELPSLAEQKFDRAGAGVAHGPRKRDGAAAPIRSRIIASDGRRRSFLDQLLMPPLHRAVALAEMHDVAVLVGEHLHLDVARARSAPAPAASGHRRTHARASERAPSNAAAKLARLRARSRMPRPPPPAAALIITGKSMRSGDVRRRPWPL